MQGQAIEQRWPFTTADLLVWDETALGTDHRLCEIHTPEELVAEWRYPIVVVVRVTDKHTAFRDTDSDNHFTHDRRLARDPIELMPVPYDLAVATIDEQHNVVWRFNGEALASLEMLKLIIGATNHNDRAPFNGEEYFWKPLWKQQRERRSATFPIAVAYSLLSMGWEVTVNGYNEWDINAALGYFVSPDRWTRFDFVWFR